MEEKNQQGGEAQGQGQTAEKAGVAGQQQGQSNSDETRSEQATQGAAVADSGGEGTTNAAPLGIGPDSAPMVGNSIPAPMDKGEPGFIGHGIGAGDGHSYSNVSEITREADQARDDTQWQLSPTDTGSVPAAPPRGEPPAEAQSAKIGKGPDYDDVKDSGRERDRGQSNAHQVPDGNSIPGPLIKDKPGFIGHNVGAGTGHGYGNPSEEEGAYQRDGAQQRTAQRTAPADFPPAAVQR